MTAVFRYPKGVYKEGGDLHGYKEHDLIIYMP